ncbi:MAG: hypothetical protein FGF51_02495 [Candidatus Brockarchaeota archaeon]|nr:hypothetical protein [Candidatus Brockarchaeota archaeon]
MVVKSPLLIAIILFLFILFLATVLILGILRGNVPREYRELYSRLKASLDDYERHLDSKNVNAAHRIIFGAELLPANANRGPDLLNPGSIEGVKTYLDRLKELGVQGVTVAINYPLYLQGFDRYQEYVEFYRQVAEEVRARGMKLDVEAGVVFSGTPFSKLRLNYSGLTFEDYKVKKRQMIINILTSLRPDYLTIGAEPDTESGLLGLSELKNPEKYVELVNYVLNGLEKGATKIGAGIGNWGNIEYVKRFCNETSLDFIVIHVYPVFGKLLYNIDAVSEIARRHSKKIMVNEAWLYKVDRPVPNVAATAEVFRLDAYSFWAPLDQQFLAVLVKSAKVNEIEYVSPFWSTYFFAYVDYNWNTARLSYGELSEMVNREAVKNIMAGKFSSTGEYYRKLVKSQEQNAAG